MFAGLPIHGFFRSRYIGRLTSGAGDQDIVETLSLDVGDSAHDRVTAHFLGDVAADLDGNTNNRGYHAFNSARDSTGQEIVPLVYSAYVDVHRLGAVSLVRAGRQSLYDTPEISYFDGLRAETRELGGRQVRFGAYAGIPVHLYQGYSTDDFLGGAYATGHLWKGARARIDWEQLQGRSGTREFRTDLVGLGAWQSLGKQVDVHVHYTRMDDQDRDILARATFTRPQWDFRLQASYYQLLQTRRDAVIEADAYYPVLKDYYPYREVRAMASKGFGDHLDIDAGMDVRRLTHDEQASAFNHEFDHYFATVEAYDLLLKGASISVTGDSWISQGRSTQSQGVEATCPIGARSKVTAGTAHYLYKYDVVTDQERDDVQSYFLKIEHKRSRALRFSIEYDYEDDDSSGYYHELRCEAICSF